ncbi:MAG: tetratricopeptide repeat protein, partial [Bacillus sp. (in: firmicutes)]
ESFEVGRWFASLGEKDQAEKVMAKLVNGNDRTSYQAKFTMALQRKKEHDWVKAERLFSDVVNSGDYRLMLEACLELAKIHEHRLKDYQLAIDYCHKAIMIVTQSEKKSIYTGQCTLEQLTFRLNRLERKKAK